MRPTHFPTSTALGLALSAALAIGCARPSDAQTVTASKQASMPVLTEATCAIFSPGGDTIYTAGEGRAVFAWDAATGALVQTLSMGSYLGYPRATNNLALNADGSRLASCGYDDYLRIWDTKTGQELHMIELLGRVEYVEYSASEAAFVTVGSARFRPAIKLWDPATGELIEEFAEGDGYLPDGGRFAASQDGKYLATISSSDTVAIWELAQKDTVCTIATAQFGATGDLEFSPDGSLLATSYRLDSTTVAIYLWNAATGDSVRAIRSDFPKKYSPAASLEFAPDGNSIFLGSNQSVLETFPVIANGDGVTGTIDSETVELIPAELVKQFDVASGDSVGIIGPMLGYPLDRYPLCVSPDGQRIVTGGRVHAALPSVWNAVTGAHLFNLGDFSLIADTKPPIKPDFEPLMLWGEARQIGVPDGGKVSFIDLTTGELGDTRSFTGTNPTLNPAGSRVVTSGAPYFGNVNNPEGLILDGLHARVILSDFATGDSLRDFTVEQEHTTERFHWLTDDGYVIAVGARRDSLDHTVDRPTAWRWDAETGVLLNTVYLYSEPAGTTALTGLVDAAINPTDSTKVAVASGDRLELWDITTGERIYSADASENGIKSGLSFSNDGQMLVYLNNLEYPAIQVRDATTGAGIRVIESTNLAGVMIAFALSPDGHSIVVGYHDQTTIEVYSTDSGQLVGSFDTYAPYNPILAWFDVFSLMVTPDAEQVVAFLRDEIQIWDLDTDLVGDLTAIRGNASPTRFALAQNAPNPFNPSTTIRFTLPEASTASLAVFNITGQHVRTLTEGNLAAGIHEVTWDGLDGTGRAVGSGVYLYRLTWTTPGATGTGSETAVRRMTYIR